MTDPKQDLHRIADSGLLCLAMIARLNGVAIDPNQARHELALGSVHASADQLVMIARSASLKAKTVNVRGKRLRGMAFPAIAEMDDGRFVIVGSVDTSGETARVLVQSPLSRGPEVITETAFTQAWTGRLVLIALRASEAGGTLKFGFSWFIPAILKYRRLLSEVLVASLFLQLFALVTPLFFQVVMDKVLVHQGYATLTVIIVAMVAVTSFEFVLSGLRSWLMSHTSSRIDVELGARLYRHLISLPLSYFDARRVGDSVARVRELENIRQFLTGQSLTTLLDVLFSVVFIAALAWYSLTLTAIVLAAIPFYAIITAVVAPMLRRRLDEKFRRGAENQAFLVESITGVRTIKSGALEPRFSQQWETQLAGYVGASFRTVRLSVWGSESIQLVSKMVTVGILFFGARLVIEGELSVGQLVAFNMLAGRVSQPVVRLAQLWQDFQQVGISVRRLADILNTVSESSGSSRGSLRAIQGDIRFDQVTFRYRPDTDDVLRRVSFHARQGEVIGIVGQSGSGKSTITRLLQRLHAPQQGKVIVDGIDLALADTSWLRRQIGVVLQENHLFARTIRENIAVHDPAMPMERVIQAATLAGAHEFISELPEGYDTIVGEQGANLSGGQRQRIAIARALVTNPRILILDEATSALDYESEAIIQQNMKSIAAGRTVIVIAHRLSAVRDANRILVMAKGEIVEAGTHKELLIQKDGQYAKLVALQAS